MVGVKGLKELGLIDIILIYIIYVATCLMKMTGEFHIYYTFIFAYAGHFYRPLCCFKYLNVCRNSYELVNE